MGHLSHGPFSKISRIFANKGAVVGGDRKAIQRELRDDGNETVSSGHRAVAHVSSQQSWQTPNPSTERELGVKCYP